MKELDVLLERWLDEQAAEAAPAHWIAFEQLIELQDPELARYLLAGESHPDPTTAQLLRVLRGH